MDRQGEGNRSADQFESLVDKRVNEVIGGLRARMAAQDQAIAELESRVKALEKALRLLTSGTGQP